MATSRLTVDVLTGRERTPPVSGVSRPKQPSTRGRGRGRGKNQKDRTQGNSSDTEYHYGSDFEDEEEDLAASSSLYSDDESENEDDAGDFDTESDVASDGGDLEASQPDEESKASVKVEEIAPLPIWLQSDASFPPLKYPKSSEDLMMPRR